MRSRKDVDPELHLLRSVAKLVKGRAGHELESARFQLYSAFEAGDRELAQRWLTSFEVALRANWQKLAVTMDLMCGSMEGVEIALRTLHDALGEP